MSTPRVSSFSSPSPLVNPRLKKWEDAMRNLHPSHKGTYSVERLQALKLYCNEASLLRVLFVCLAVPAPALLVAIGTECVPLQDPMAGWKANFGAWIRLGLIGFTASIGLIVQTNEMVPVSKIPKWKVLFAAAITGVLYVFSQRGLASIWVYPMPFGYILFAPIYASLLVTTFLAAIGPTAFREKTTLGHQLRQQLGIIMVQTSMVCIYPAFSALYFRLEYIHQTALIFALPIIKFTIQTAVVWFSRHIEEYIPGVVVFSVEVFNALYVTKCMQNAKSYMTYVAILLFDAVDLVLVFYDMKVCKEPGVLEQRKGSLIRMRSSLRLRISKAPGDLDKQIQEVIQTQDTIDKQIEDTIVQPYAVVPVSQGVPNSVFTIRVPETASAINLAEKQKFVYQSLKVLFQCEYVVLVKYVESMVPMVYSLYVATLSGLPSAKYYPETRGMTSDRVYTMVLTVMGYAWLEVLSLVALHFAVKRKFGFSPISVLAFVLENQMIELQARLTVWFTFIFELTLIHFGVDFTLQFAWMKHH